MKQTLGTGLGGGWGDVYNIFIWFQVKNFSDVHPDYGARIQALLDKYNAEKPKNAVHTYVQAGSHLAAREKANL